MYCSQLTEADEMAFSSENQQWIRDEIQASYNKLLKQIRPPSGFKKALNLMREWGVLAVNLTIIVTLRVFAATQWSAANRRLVDDATSHTKTDERLKGVEEKLAGLRALIAASQPARKQNQEAAKEILAEARQKAIPIPEGVVEQAGNSFIEAARTDPKAWDVALEFMSYRSVLNPNVDYRSSIEPLPQSNAEVHHINAGYTPGRAEPTIKHSTGDWVPIAQAAQLETIGENLNAKHLKGPRLLFVKGGIVSIDNKFIRHVVYEGVEVHYSGAPLIMESATFVNCKFVITNGDPGRRFGAELLMSSAVNFRNAA